MKRCEKTLAVSGRVSVPEFHVQFTACWLQLDTSESSEEWHVCMTARELLVHSEIKDERLIKHACFALSDNQPDFYQFQNNSSCV
jgi:hypothetical protein